MIKKLIKDLRFKITRVSDKTTHKRQIKVKGNFSISVLRKFQNDLLKKYIVNLDNIDSVLNIGATQDDEDKEGKLYKDYFENIEYYTLDMHRIDNNPYHFNLDLHDLSKLDKKFNLVLLMSVLEHVENPFMVISQIKTIIETKGYLFITAPFFYPIHKNLKKQFSDYWRFTDDALRILCKDFKEIWIKKSASVILSVRDRDNYWDDEKTTVGYCALFKMV